MIWTRCRARKRAKLSHEVTLLSKDTCKEMNQFIALARVSSVAQKEEGTSLEVQETALQAYAQSQGGVIVKLWKIAETASKSEQRVSFKEILTYAKANSQRIDGLLVYKVDRA